MGAKGDDMLGRTTPDMPLAEQRPTPARIAATGRHQPRDPRERSPRRMIVTALLAVAARLAPTVAAPAPPAAQALPPDGPRERLNAWG